MCRWGNTKSVQTKNGAVSVDSCIADIVQNLNDLGMPTIASCCGHGEQPGNIALKDGREIMICSYADARKVEALFPPINPRPSEWKYTIRRWLIHRLLPSRNQDKE